MLGEAFSVASPAVPQHHEFLSVVATKTMSLVPCRGQVKIFLRWLQYVVHMVVYDRQHVIINADETALATVRHSGVGMACCAARRNSARVGRPRDPVDKAFTHVTYFAVVCDCAELQPLLPQLLLARYPRNAAVPAVLQAQYRSCGHPFEFWNGSAGRVTPVIFRKWVTRLRQAVGSFNAGAWIVLILDCATSHLDRASVAHLRRLGVLVVIIPAKMTWLLQALDVYAFGKLKRGLREAEARARANAPDGQIPPGAWMKLATAVIRRDIINCDWTRKLGRLGAGESCEDLSAPVSDLLGGAEITPALPTRAEFALLLNRPPDSSVTRALHASIMGQALAVRQMPLQAQPPHAATFILPVSQPAPPSRSRRETFEAMEARDVLSYFADMRHVTCAPLHPFEDARTVQLAGPPVAED